MTYVRAHSVNTIVALIAKLRPFAPQPRCCKWSCCEQFKKQALVVSIKNIQKMVCSRCLHWGFAKCEVLQSKYLEGVQRIVFALCIVVERFRANGISSVVAVSIAHRTLVAECTSNCAETNAVSDPAFV